jgi:hypothetical protein
MRKLLTISLIALLGATTAAAEEKKLYKWTDADGNVYFGDRIPAEYAERPKTVLNDQGIAVDKLAGKKTAEQKAQEARDQEIAVAQELQKRADMALLNTYLSVEEIVLHRDRRVELFQAQARVTELYLKNLERRMKGLRDDASKYRPYSDDENAPMIAEELAEDLRETKETIARHERNLAKYESNEKAIIERFNSDIERFKTLKGIKDPPQTALAGS